MTDQPFLLRTVVGSETEYSVAPSREAKASGADVAQVSGELCLEIFRLMREDEGFPPQNFRTSLRNGGVFYQDINAHPEYASPEVANGYDAALYGLAGDLLITKAIRNIEARNGGAPRLQAFRNNHDAADKTWGSHENYRFPRHLGVGPLIEDLLPYLVSRTPFVGAGHFSFRGEPTDTAAHVLTTQRSREMHETHGTQSTRSRPMINTRDEPHGRRSLMYRAQVICGDSNVSHTASIAKYGFGTIAVAVIAAGMAPKRGRLHGNPLKMLHAINEEQSFKGTLMTARGSISVFDHQRLWLLAADAFIDRFGTDKLGGDEKTKYVLDATRRLIDGTEQFALTGRDEILDGASDLVNKIKGARRICTRLGVDPDVPISKLAPEVALGVRTKLAALDLSYHRVGGSQILKSLNVDRVFSVEQLRDAAAFAPEGRPSVREFVFDTLGPSAVDDWNRIDLHPDAIHDDPSKYAIFDDPEFPDRDRLAAAAQKYGNPKVMLRELSSSSEAGLDRLAADAVPPRLRQARTMELS